MTLRLTVDGPRWREHLREVAQAHPGLVPVAKGNGYGLGIGRLARRAQWLGVDTLAVGTYAELADAASRFDGSLSVLTPWRPFVTDPDPEVADRVVHTVSRLDDVAALAERQPHARVLLERMTSMRRHGLTVSSLWEAALEARRLGLRVEGVTIHLPMGRHPGANLAEARALVNDAVGAEVGTVWVSHLTTAELDVLRHAYPDLTIRPRIGTALWLGVRGALSVSGTVLDVHEVARGEAYGYRGRTASRRGHLLVVSGGTAHGIGLAAPTGESSPRARAATLARGGLESVGVVRSPFFLPGERGAEQLSFAEPPHMQASMLLLPRGARVPEVGDRLDARVRYTATTFDEIVITD